MNDKVNNYISRQGGKLISRSAKSYYYILNGVVLRVSDHVATNSDGQFSIVSTKVPDQYIVYRKDSGVVQVYNYRTLQAFIRSLIGLAAFCSKLNFTDIPHTGPSLEGMVNIGGLTKGQQQQIQRWLNGQN